MSIHVALNHVTRYRYDRPVALGPQVIRLRPAPHCRTRVLAYSLKITPPEHFLNWQQDPYGNYLARAVFPERTEELRLEVDLVAEASIVNPFDFFLEPAAEHFPFRYAEPLLRDLAPYLATVPPTPRLEAFLDSVPRVTRPTTAFLFELNRRLCADVRYLIRMEPGVQTPEQTLELRSGSCRDSGWLLVQVLRHLGLAARFVSGYLVQLAPDEKSLDGPSGPEQDFTDLHAWCEVYLPGAGWVGLDPTSGLFAGEGHLPLACSADPESAAPITGHTDACECDFSYAMKVERIWEAPRVTKPYTEEQWAEVVRLGHAIDADLERHDVRLTMGGEPTFVSVDDRQGAEWNTDALGPTKRGLSLELMRRLKTRYAPQGLLHCGQGKWYPGEPLPRWSLACFWRRDGEPVWRDAELFADESRDYGASAEQAAGFLRMLALRLGVEPGHAFPAYEDVFYYLWRERRLPSNVDPFDSRLDDLLERGRLRRVFTRGLDAVVGHVLPLARSLGGDAWQSGPWFLRDERCYLIPGDSPIGLRLPLDSQPWAAPTDQPWIAEADPSRSVPPLAPYPAIVGRLQTRLDPSRDGRSIEARPASARGEAIGRLHRTRRPPDTQPMPRESAAWITRTAICAEPRDGRLHVFMPPQPVLESYLELLAAVEQTAAELALPVVIEGYEPPRDARLEHFRITPDPGVIEVNVQPCTSWEQLVDHTDFLYEAARRTRLSTEKFLLDGRHGGTGGGNHFVVGGASAEDSPFLRRPDLLASMIAYWHDHPSLSYLFSGLFLGPTSQAPRIDEARNDSVYEIEIAFREIERAGGTPPPWLVDRILRNLLIDVSGNTHRAEFCIDKLYSPDSASGRLGLLELRAFEMPPHARMSLTQQLLLRGLIARFWKEPYRPARLTRWGTALHDRFLLPHFVWQDFEDVIEETVRAGYALDAGWFAPHFEFRFPLLGAFAARGVAVELRAALEPWHVLGEEGAPGGTVRYVDSSVERLQVKTTGLVDGRYRLTCNGSAVALQPTGTVGEFVGGVRYRAWQPPSSLHPTIGAHAPLVFDLVDTWMRRSLGGCQYHVAHPGGRSYETYPVNAYEAEGRRLARFFRIGHTPGRIEIAPGTPSPDFPFTLDLRRP